MLSNYSSFFEFIAAVYCTMSIDNILTQKIWSVDYFEGFKRALDGMSFEGNSNITSELVEKNRNRVNIMQTKLTKKSVLMLCYITLILLFCGLEADLSNSCTVQSVYTSIITGSSIVLLCHLLSRYIFKKWKWTFIGVSSMCIASGITYFHHIAGTKIEAHLITYSVIALLLWPILWQIFLVWVYKSLYYGYVKHEMLRVKHDYELALHIIQNNGDVNNLPSDYGKILQKNTICHKNDSTQKAIDDSITEYAQLLEAKLKH